MTQETTHTPEPWLLVKHSNSNLCGARCVSSNWFLFEDALERDAARIVACVNACAGMADPAAEIAALRAALEKFTILNPNHYRDIAGLIQNAKDVLSKENEAGHE